MTSCVIKAQDREAYKLLVLRLWAEMGEPGSSPLGIQKWFSLSERVCIIRPLQVVASTQIAVAGTKAQTDSHEL